MIRKTETIVMKSTRFRLPGKKVLTASDHEFEVVIVDPTESPVERPKKSGGVLKNEFTLEGMRRSHLIRGRKSGILKRPKSRWMRRQNKSVLPSLGRADAVISVYGKKANFMWIRIE